MLRHPSLVPLSHQHHDALALCVRIERGLRDDPSPEKAAELSRKAGDLFELELRNHFDLEERLLFPAIQKHLGPLTLVEELIDEHRQLEGLIGRLPAALPEFAAALSAHIRREEAELFEDIQSRLPADCLKELERAFTAEAVRVCL